MIGVIDYGAGNLCSVRNALDALGVRSATVDTKSGIEAADALILPGVGEFGSAMKELSARGLCAVLKSAAEAGVPLLGICLGMQMLFEESEESPGVRGLALLPGRSARFSDKYGLKIPHMGWNSITPLKESRLLKGISAGSYMYFVHSYYVRCGRREDAAAGASYGDDFDAAAERGTVFGCQFHPEKSGSEGFLILKNFIEIAEGKR
ncbi:MAG: imidazole glycerol phosphate synthase subunit HisH [Synergistes sp.]|nr:imidazole glycerol phosphate synthase subunit HisH [Synergistes sp.]